MSILKIYFDGFKVFLNRCYVKYNDLFWMIVCILIVVLFLKGINPK